VALIKCYHIPKMGNLLSFHVAFGIIIKGITNIT
jgi:hypothetical protein